MASLGASSVTPGQAFCLMRAQGRNPHSHAAPSLATVSRSAIPGGQELGGQVLSISTLAAAASRVSSSRPIAPRSAVSRAVTEQEMQRTQKAFVQRTRIPSTLAKRWREVHGSNDWKGMLDPMDSDLREELIRYGEFAQACYDGFDNAEHSRYKGSCRYSRDTLLQKVGLTDTGYEVTKYLYATTDVKSFLLKNEHEAAWSRDSNWSGFVAVCTDEERIKEMGRRDIVVAWRGTATKLEWAANLAKDLVPSSLDDRHKGDKWYVKLQVERGFLSLYTTKNSQTRYNKNSVREQLLCELRRVIKKYDDETLSITVTGHSLGAAMAVLSAYDIAESGVNRHAADVEVPSEWHQHTTPTPTSDPSKTMHVNAIPVTVFSFAGPRVGNNPFVDHIQNLGVKVLRVVNVKDLVPTVPGLVFNESFKFFNNLLDKLPWTYSHCGVEIEINNEHSPYLKPRAGPLNAHNMEAYLHMLAGYEGPGRGIGNDFKLIVKRDISLVNKGSDFLKPQKYIPSSWWQVENKGLRLSENGEWVQADRDPEDIPNADDA